MFLLRDKKVQYCPTLLLVVISVMLLSCVVRKLDFFISQQKYIVRPIKRLEILPGMRISTQNLQKFYVKRFMAKNIVKELYFVDSHQILTGISFISNGKRKKEFCLISKPVAVTTEYLIQPAEVSPMVCYAWGILKH